MQCGLPSTSTGSAWRFHVPRIWTRSINACKFPVKRKTLNVVDTFVSCLFVVVMFPPTSSLSCTSGQFFHSETKYVHLTLYASLVPFRCVPSLHRNFSFSRDRTSPAALAQKIALAGVPCVGKINDFLLPGAQPSTRGLAELQKPASPWSSILAAGALKSSPSASMPSGFIGHCGKPHK
jgi:hypothetical protein